MPFLLLWYASPSFWKITRLRLLVIISILLLLFLLLRLYFIHFFILFQTFLNILLIVIFTHVCLCLARHYIFWLLHLVSFLFPVFSLWFVFGVLLLLLTLLGSSLRWNLLLICPINLSWNRLPTLVLYICLILLSLAGWINLISW